VRFRCRADSGGVRSHPAPSLYQEVIIASTERTRVNDQIRISPVRLIDSGGEQVGIVPLERARDAAHEASLDLVEIAPDARPPVVRVMDWGKFRFEKAKREKEARKRQHTVDVKELKLRPRTDDHDLDVKLRNARRFLSKGAKVKFTVRFRGPELRRPDLGSAVLDGLVEALGEEANVEARSRGLEGRQMTMVVAPA
jgi:translation initiation factor IF-3